MVGTVLVDVVVLGVVRMVVRWLMVGPGWWWCEGRWFVKEASYRRERKHPADGLFSTYWNKEDDRWRSRAEGGNGGALYDVYEDGPLVMVPAGRCPRLGVELPPLAVVHRCLSGVSCPSGRGLFQVGRYSVVCGVMCGLRLCRVGGRMCLLPRSVPTVEGPRRPGSAGHVVWLVETSGTPWRGVLVVPLVTLVSRS